MKHVLITGGAGFIGSHLTERFLREGFAVSAVDNFVTGQRANIAQFEKRSEYHFVEADVSLPLEESRLPLIARYGLHGVLHFACPASPVDFEKIPFEILQVDSLGTFETVGLALRHRARYVLASTSEIYGDPLEHPQSEDYWGNVNTLGPRACYDETKRFAEAIVSTAIRGAGTWRGERYEPLNGAMVRIFNTYGPRMRPDDGRVVPELCMQALRGEPLTIHGDGKQTRSFCYVEDLVEGIFRLYQSGLRVPVNIGNPVERTILNFAEVIQSLSNKKSPVKSAIRFLPGREDDPKRRCPDISRAKTLLGWEPRWELEAGLQKTLEYFGLGL